jgi:hypothetical protein
MLMKLISQVRLGPRLRIAPANPSVAKPREPPKLAAARCARLRLDPQTRRRSSIPPSQAHLMKWLTWRTTTRHNLWVPQRSEGAKQDSDWLRLSSLAWAWVWRSAARLSELTEDGFGRPSTSLAVLCFSLQSPRLQADRDHVDVSLWSRTRLLRETIRMPVISGGPYGFEHVNVATQRRHPDSLLNWTERIIRKACVSSGKRLQTHFWQNEPKFYLD